LPFPIRGQLDCLIQIICPLFPCHFPATASHAPSEWPDTGPPTADHLTILLHTTRDNSTATPTTRDNATAVALTCTCPRATSPSWRLSWQPRSSSARCAPHPCAAAQRRSGRADERPCASTAGAARPDRGGAEALASRAGRDAGGDGGGGARPTTASIPTRVLDNGLKRSLIVVAAAAWCAGCRAPTAAAAAEQ
jgi:hypothetical protein